MSEIKNISLESLKRTHGNGAESVFQKVAEVGGFGAIEPNYKGGLDISGLPESTYNRIVKLVTVEEEGDSAKADKEAAAKKKADDEKGKKEPDNTTTKNK